jgi:signal peptidase I
MSPTYEPGDRVLVRRLAAGRLRRDDVVVVERPDDEAGWRDLPPFDGRIDGRTWNIKRVVALPGDPVPVVVLDAVAGLPVRVPPDSLVLLGDHRVSADSRYWGFYPADRLLGTVVGRSRRRGPEPWS